MKHTQKLILLLLFLLTSWVGLAQQVYLSDSVLVVDTLDASSTRQVTFAASATQNYGFDARDVSAWTENYEAIKMSDGGNYFVPFKSVGENQTDEVMANVQIEGYDATFLSFKTKSGAVLAHTAAGSNNFKLSVPANANAVYAWYGTEKLGKLNVKSLKALTRKVVIVPVNNTAYNTTYVVDSLNKTYKQANVSWTGTTASSFEFNLGTDGLEAADATLFSKYSPEMRALRDAYIAHDSTYDKNAYYLFVVPKFTDASQVGYMVRGKGLGFITPSAKVRDIAHELGHGAFGLEHTFPNPPQGSTANLMDYSQGSQLTQKQWEKIHSPMPVISWLDGEEDGSALNVDYFGQSVKAPNGSNQRIHQEAFCVLNNNNQTVAFVLPEGKSFVWVNEGGFLGYFENGVPSNKTSYLFYVEDKYNRIYQPVSWGIYLAASDIGSFSIDLATSPLGTISNLATGLLKIATLQFDIEKTWQRIVDADLTDVSYVVSSIALAYLSGPKCKSMIVAKEEREFQELLVEYATKTRPQKLSWPAILELFKKGKEFERLMSRHFREIYPAKNGYSITNQVYLKVDGVVSVADDIIYNSNTGQFILNETKYGITNTLRKNQKIIEDAIKAGEEIEVRSINGIRDASNNIVRFQGSKIKINKILRSHSIDGKISNNTIKTIWTQ